jgi:hypothetical protein
MNFGLFPMLARYKEFKFDWERPYLEGSDERIFKNTFADIANILATCAANHTRFEIECYDIGHLYTLRHFADRGLVKPPFFIQSVFGILGGIGPHPEDVAPEQCPAGARRAPRSSRASAWRSPAPTKRARCCSSRAPTTSISEPRRAVGRRWRNDPYGGTGAFHADANLDSTAAAGL